MKVIFLHIIRAICIVPFLFILYAALCNWKNGMVFIETKCYGMQAFTLTILLYATSFYRVLITCLIGMVVSTVLIKKWKEQRN